MIAARQTKSLVPLFAVGLLALIAAAPALTGEFLGGDDRTLLLNHALVNHPTLENVVKLFSLEAQRDLYQPLPLLTFAAEFKLVRWLNLPLTNEGRGAATILFHATNLALHIANVVLTFLLVRRVSKSGLMAFVAAALLSVHPLSVESYAWLNGRMTLLSVFFSLLTLICAQRLYERKSMGLMTTAIAAALLAMCSKVRMELPLLLLLLAWIQHQKPPRRWWFGFAGVLLVTVVFALLNVWTTTEEGMFEGAGKMQGSRLARTVITLGWYIRALVWPTALSPYYPTDDVVNWTHPLIPSSALIVGLATLAVLISLRWTRMGLIAALWFLLSVGPTLPLVPSRYLMAADRYVYLANIGVYWVAGWVVCRAMQRWKEPSARGVLGIVAAIVLIGCIGLSWRQAGYYHSDVRRYLRIAELSPTRAGVWERLAWAYFDAGEYKQAIASTQREAANGRGARGPFLDQIVGMSLHKLGRTDEAVELLLAAVKELPDDAKAHTRAARVLADCGRMEEAIVLYRRAVELNPTLNPAVVQLADLLRKTGQPDASGAYYEQALENNPYDANSITGLAEIHMARGDYAVAVPTLEALLKWMPNHVTARTNLGVCYAQLGREREAIDQYREALNIEPGLPVASTNLAMLYLRIRQPDEALAVMGAAVSRYPADLTALIGYQDVCAATGHQADALRAWQRAATQMPQSRLIAGWLAWSTVLAASPDAENLLEPDASSGTTPMRMAWAFQRVRHGQPDSMIELIRRLGTSPPPDLPDALDRLMQALTDYGMRHSENVWCYYLIAEILVAHGDSRADAALSAFEQLCPEPACTRRAADLRSRMTPTGADPAAP